FFEMLGNFSFGDYFKREAIAWAWELLTTVYKLPEEKLWVTVYVEDDEAYDIWNKEIGVPAERIVRIGDNKGARYMSDNFWMMGDTGPCGPCSEIFYDRGPSVQGGPPGSPDEDGDRYMEIWNLVFTQFNRDTAGNMNRLPKPNIDTGMGLERLASVLQGVPTNYDIDLFQNLMAAAKAAVEAVGATNVDPQCPSLKVIADHIRSCSFAIADGVVPGNEGRAYVLRRICRRAIRHGYKLGARGTFFYKLVEPLAREMGDIYPELKNPRIAEVLRAEEERFLQTLSNGMQILDEAVAATTNGVLDGTIAFKLHDTYGFPVDLTGDVCRERGLVVDTEGFDAAMLEQRNKARAAGKFKVAADVLFTGDNNEFTGYEKLRLEGSKVLAVYKEGVEVERAEAGDDVLVVLDKTPFYAEMGGQVGDVGRMENATTLVTVTDCVKLKAAVFSHVAHINEGSLGKGDVVNCEVDTAVRTAVARNHSATHLMHKALREVLGSHVQQKGSLVNAAVTRFDFVHDKPMTAEEIRAVEDQVNAEILAN
ncbi:MAG: alanine--tRNA ligase, partial [Duodenibacillus sp.]